jgi:hypothetical protein
MDFREYEIVRDGDEIVVVGTIRDPVHWDFSIRICEDDVPGMTWLVLRKKMIWLLLRSFFRLRRRHHWSQERSEHLAEGKRRRQSACEKAAERTPSHREAAQQGGEPPAPGVRRAAAGER